MKKPAYLLSALLLFSFVGCRPNLGFHVEGGEPLYVTDASPDPINVNLLKRPVPADAETFEAIPLLAGAPRNVIPYARDKNRVFAGILSRPHILVNSHPRTFEILTIDGKYAKDGRQAYFCGIALANSDPKSFRVLAEPYSCDQNQAYAGVVPFDIAAPDKFEVVRSGHSQFPWMPAHRGLKEREQCNPRTSISGWARDGAFYYYAYRRIERADYDSFTVLNSRYAKDADRVYYCADRKVMIVKDADPVTFEVDPDYTIRAKDKNRSYIKGRVDG
ncbi:DKNYY domain-containing protein [Rosistilla oblonga]|uniref:DKNYY domain-containing protein n=1 Tax=Rosistilla oblonga TaxID=2527990 RepID=UPI003A9707D2